MSTATLDARPSAGYERISRFRVNRDGIDTVVSRGVDRQGADADAAAALRGLGELVHFTDNNRSASQYATKEREAWLALLEAVRAGTFSHVLVWLLDRAARTTDDVEALLAACRQGNAVIVQTASNITADPNNPDDIFRLKLAGLLAEYEVAKMSLRAKRMKDDAAKTGAPHGGRKRFGYEPGMLEENKLEATVIRLLVARLLAGESLASLVRWLEAEKVPTARGGKWTPANLGAMLRGPHLAGLRVHRGEVIGAAAWPAIISLGDHEAVTDLLSNPARRTTTTNARVYLLAGLASCAECGAPVRGRPLHKTRADGTRGRAYACVTGRHVHRPVTDVDETVTEYVVARLERMSADGIELSDDDANALAELVDHRAALIAKRDALEDKWTAGEIDDARLARLSSKVDTAIAEADDAIQVARNSARAPVAALHGMTGTDARARWVGASLGQQRMIVDTLCTVALRGGGRFDPVAHVAIEWRAA